MIAELLAGDLFHLFDIAHYFGFDGRIDFLAVFIVLRAGFRRDCEALRNGKTDVCHFRKVCALAAEKLTHVCVALTEQVTIFFCCHCVNFLHFLFIKVLLTLLD